MKLKHWNFGLFFVTALLATTACTPPHEALLANAASGPGYPVDCRDTHTSDFRPLNGLQLGAGENPAAPPNRTIGNGDISKLH
jgi:hypothetical protein